MSDPSVGLEIARIKGSDDLPVPPYSQPPELAGSSLPMPTKLKLIQAYITSLEYNYTGEAFFVKKKDRGFRHVTSTAKLIIREALPIQCVEAVFVGAYLTADMTEVDRYPVCFRSSLDGRVYRHIILAVRSGSVWGALGLSRRDTLMYKDLRYSSFSELIANFRTSYAGTWHLLEHVWVGFPLPHDVSSNVPVKWKVMRASVGTDTEWASAAPDLDRFVVCAPALFERFSSTGKVPDHPLLSGSSNAAGDGEGGAMGGGGDDPRGSPGETSPGAVSPGAPSCWQGSAAVRGRRRASTSVGKPAAKEKRGSGYSSCKESTRASGGGGGRSGGGRSGSTYLASPPRARAVSVGSGMVGSPGKVQRQVIDSGASAAPEAEASSTLASSMRLPV